MNRPTVSATCAGGSGRYDWTADWDGGDHVERLSRVSSPRSLRLPSSHSGLEEGTHTLSVSCAEADGRARGEATLTVPVGAHGPDLGTVQLASVTSTDYRTPSWMEGTFAVPVVTAPGDPYLLVLRVSAANNANFYRWSVDTQNPYPDGIVQVGTKSYLYLDALARIMHAQP